MNKALHPAPYRWARVIGLPFKIYVTIAWLAVEWYRDSAGRYRDDLVPDILLGGYGISFLVLCVLALFQRKQRDHIGSTFSFLWALIAVILSLFCHPYLSKL